MTLKADVSPPRHTWWYRPLLAVARKLALPIVARRFRLEVERYDGDIPDASIVMFNHTCDYDFLGVLAGFPHYARFVASDALIRKRPMRILMGLVSDFIFRRKGESADNVVESVVITIKKGVHVCIAPEGGESLNGATSSIRPRTGQMVKDANAGMVTLRMVGGYFSKPSWASNPRKGPIYGNVVGVYTKEQMASMTSQEINDLIYRDLYVNSYEWQRENRIVYEGERLAEHMEKILYMCPGCNGIGTLVSEGDDLRCTDCDLHLSVDGYGFFHGEGLVFDNLYDWDIWQREQISSRLDEFRADPEKVIFSDSDQILMRLENNYPCVMDEVVTLSMSAARVTIRGDVVDLDFPLDEIQSITAVTRADVGIVYEGEYYQIRSRDSRSGVKYKQLFAMLRGKPHL